MPQVSLPTRDAFTDHVDQRALDNWERTFRLTADSGLQGFRAVFVPQIMNWEALVSDKPHAWSPFVRDKDQERIMEAYHGSMERVASRKVWPTWLKC